MSKERVYKKKHYCYVTWSVVLIFISLILVMTFTKNWDMRISGYAVVFVAVMSFVTFSKRVSENIHAYTFLIVSILDIFLYSYMSRDIDITIIVLCVLTILCSFYRRMRCLLLLHGMTVVLMVAHAGFLGSVSFASWEEVINFIVKMIALTFVQVFVTFNVYRMNDTERELRASVE